MTRYPNDFTEKKVRAFLIDLNEDARLLARETTEGHYKRVAKATVGKKPGKCFRPTPIPQRSANQAIQIVSEVLKDASTAQDWLDELSAQTYGFVTASTNGSKDVYQTVREQFAMFVYALTAFYLRRFARNAKEREAAAELLYESMLPLVERRGGWHTHTRLLRELSSNDTKSLINRWYRQSLPEFVDAVRMTFKCAIWAHFRFVMAESKQTTLGEDLIGLKPNANPPFKRNAVLEEIRRDREKIIGRLGQHLFPVCLKAAQGLPLRVQKLVALLMLGGVPHTGTRRARAKDAARRQPELFHSCLSRYFATKADEPNPNVIDHKFRAPLSDMLVNHLDMWSEIVSFLEDENPDKDGISAANLECIVFALFEGRKNLDRAFHNTAFTIFKKIGQSIALQHQRGEIVPALPSEFNAELDAELPALLETFLLNNPVLTCEQLVGITQYLCERAGTTREKRIHFWSKLLVDLNEVTHS